MAQAIVCGAGAAGLASAACLKRAGVEPLVLERGPALGTSWRRRYPALRLNTLGWMSTLPGYRASRRRYGDYPTRDDWIRYLEDYVQHHDLAIECGVEVSGIERANGAWRVETDRDSREAPFVVVATGFDREPRIPDWPGRDGFAGELLHAAAYRDPEPFRGRDVLVVGPGVTGSEVAAFVADGGAGRVRVAMRTPPNIVPRWWLGVPMNVPALLLDALPPNAADSLGRLSQRLIYGDLSRYGVPFPPLGIRRTLEERFMGPAVDAGFVRALKEGRIEIVPAVAAFEGRDVILADQSRIQPEVVDLRHRLPPRTGGPRRPPRPARRERDASGLARHRGRRRPQPVLRRLLRARKRSAAADALRGPPPGSPRQAPPARDAAAGAGQSRDDRLTRPLLEADADRDPLRMFRTWFDEARDTGMELPEAVALATATPDGAPSARMVLLKGADEAGLVFFTSYTSRKARELLANPRAALLFHWPQLGRQVRVEGSVSQVPREETEGYVRSRPRASQISALASRQSEPLHGREELEARVEELSAATPTRTRRSRTTGAATGCSRRSGSSAAPPRSPARPPPLPTYWRRVGNRAPLPLGTRD